MNNILCLGDFSSGKSSFLNMLLGVSILPEQLQSTNLPVIKIHSGETAGIYIREEGQKYGRPIASWTKVPEDWSTFEYIELTVPNHPLLDKGLVLWDSPGINSTNTQHIKHLEEFLTKNEDLFQSVLYFIQGNIQNTQLEFIRKWPKLQTNMTVVVNIKEVLSKADCNKIYNEVKNTVQSHFIHIPVELLYIGDLYDEFAEESEIKSKGYDDPARIALWNKIAIDFDALKKKHQNSITGERIFELLKSETASKFADINERERLLHVVEEYWENGKYSETAPILLKLADYGYADVHYKLGRCYYDELGLERDYNKAFIWFNKAAENGSFKGKYYCGLCYFYGDGITQDYKKAGDSFLDPAQQGIADAQYHIALLYETGNGIMQDYSEMADWLQLAAEQGHSLAQYKLGKCFYNGKGVTKNYSEALKWFSKCAEKGNPKAWFELAEMYMLGIGVNKDISIAKNCYKKAIRSGDESLRKTASDKLNTIRKSRNKKITVLSVIALMITWLVVIISLTQSRSVIEKPYSPSTDNSVNSVSSVPASATYISASEENISFPSEGGSSSTYISTDGNSWAISLGTADWITTSRDGNTITLNCQRNSGSERTDYFEVRSDNRTKRIKITQSAELTTSSAAPSASINNVWVDHNVWKDSEFGMIIHVKFDIENRRNKLCFCIAYFFYASGTILQDYNGSYTTVNGQVCASTKFTPGYINTSYGDLEIFMPYSEMHMDSGKYNLKFKVAIYDNSVLCWSDYVNFTFSK